MIEKLLKKFGYCPALEVDRAFREGRDQGEDDMHRYYESMIENVKLKYSGAERERDHLLKILSEHAAVQMPTIIISTPVEDSL